MPSKAFLYAHALISLKPSQIVWYALRRGLRVGQRCRLDVDFAPRAGNTSHKTAFLSYPMKAESAEHFRFLNRSKRFDGGVPEWQNADMARLWSYNLHYFDYLQDPALTLEQKQAIVEDWIVCNPRGTVTAWEPYTASLRIVNWVKFALNAGQDVPPDSLKSLAEQARWMRHNLELHILANHFFKNIKALLFAGHFFGQGEALKWFAYACRQLDRELDEQQLPDGGHYERSPMYHAIFLEDLLDILNFCGHALPEALLRKLESAAVRASVFLRDLRHSNGDWPLFNDAAFGIAPEPGLLLEYSLRVLGAEALDVATQSAFKSSGYYLLGDAHKRMIIDCGETGPRYQPGHTHCDTLSYELSIGDQTIVVDTGTFDYESGPARTLDRSTAAHNTVCVDESEQSEVWGLFRVARRANPGHVEFESNSTHAGFRGSHDGYQRLAEPVRHERGVDFDGSGWTVIDRLEGKGEHTLDSYIHFHPQVHASLNGRCIELRNESGQLSATVNITGPGDVMLEAAVYHPRFGIELQNQRLRIRYRGVLPVSLSYRIEPDAGL